MIVLPLASTGTVVSSPCRRPAPKTCRWINSDERRQDSRAGADPVGQRRHVEVDALASIGLALPVERLVLAELGVQDHRQQARPDVPRGMTWNGAGGWVIFSQDRQVNFSRTVWITFHWRGTTSKVSVIVSPSLASLPPQHGQAVGAGIDHALAWQMRRQRAPAPASCG